jgi:hypothetical protein
VRTKWIVSPSRWIFREEKCDSRIPFESFADDILRKLFQGKGLVYSGNDSELIPDSRGLLRTLSKLRVPIHMDITDENIRTSRGGRRTLATKGERALHRLKFVLSTVSASNTPTILDSGSKEKESRGLSQTWITDHIPNLCVLRPFSNLRNTNLELKYSYIFMRRSIMPA